MKKLVICAAVLFTAAFCCAQQKGDFEKQLDLQPAHHEGKMSVSACKVDLSQKYGWYVDFRSCDLSKENLNELDQKTVMSHLIFNDKTIWPKGDKMPKWLNPQKIMEIGKTPGLNIKQLHAQGITGKGIGIAIIDQSLPEHSEYQDRLLFYKDYTDDKEGSMHGPSMLSIAAGSTVGAAPEVYIYYVATIFRQNGVFNARPIAEAIEELLLLNKTLPKDRKISVISISRYFQDGDEGREDFLKALKAAKKQNIAVFLVDESKVASLSRTGYMVDPDDSKFYKHHCCDLLSYCADRYLQAVTVPTDFRITASETGRDDYAAYSDGGISSSVPYYAGVYALAKQVYPALTAEEFEKAARSTAHSKKIKDDETGEEAEVKYFINPVGLIEYFQKKAAGKGGKAAAGADEDPAKKIDALKQALNKAIEVKK